MGGGKFEAVGRPPSCMFGKGFAVPIEEEDGIEFPNEEDTNGEANGVGFPKEGVANGVGFPIKEEDGIEFSNEEKEVVGCVGFAFFEALEIGLDVPKGEVCFVEFGFEKVGGFAGSEDEGLGFGVKIGFENGVMIGFAFGIVFGF